MRFFFREGNLNVQSSFIGKEDMAQSVGIDSDLAAGDPMVFLFDQIHFQIAHFQNSFRDEERPFQCECFRKGVAEIDENVNFLPVSAVVEEVAVAIPGHADDGRECSHAFAVPVELYKIESDALTLVLFCPIGTAETHSVGSGKRAGRIDGKLGGKNRFFCSGLDDQISIADDQLRLRRRVLCCRDIPAAGGFRGGESSMQQKQHTEKRVKNRRRGMNEKMERGDC